MRLLPNGASNQGAKSGLSSQHSRVLQWTGFLPRAEAKKQTPPKRPFPYLPPHSHGTVSSPNPRLEEREREKAGGRWSSLNGCRRLVLSFDGTSRPAQERSLKRWPATTLLAQRY